jgi:N-acetylmuramoyl-L-alanine amidase
VRVVATAAAFLCALLVMPALASGKARGPFDFELAAPSAAAVAAGGPTASRTLHTQRRFNLVGLHWRGHASAAIRLRVRRPTGTWSHWETLAAHPGHNPDTDSDEPSVSSSDPLWVGSADAVQYRLSRPLRGLRLHFVNVASELRSARAAQDPEPAFVSRRAWGASKCRPRAAPEYGAVKAVHVHHTVSLNDYAPEEGPAIVLSVCRYHRNSNGWNDIGYNALVDKYGVLYEGRAGGLDQAVVGAQAQGFNDETAGIASIGDHTSVEATPETLSALAAYIRWKLGVHGQPLSGPVTLRSDGGPATKYPAGARVTLERVIGHRDTGRTACPGELLYAQLDELRALVVSGVGVLPTLATRLSATLADSSVDFGDVVPVTGLLSGPGGSPLVNETVEVQTNGTGLWRTTSTATTAPDGTFATELRPRRRLYVRLRYPGRAELRRATSARLLLHLRPLITLRSPVTSSARGARVPVKGTVSPRKRFVTLVVQQRREGRYRRAGVRAVRARRGRFSTSFKPAVAASYRYAVIALNDADTDRGSTGWQPLRVRR